MALGEFNIVGDVTETLRTLLADLDVTLDSPANLQTGGDEAFARINLYLYRVVENPNAKNQPWRTLPSGRQQYPPLALNLYYLLTPYASDPLSAHQVLSHAMQTLHDNAILSGADLTEPLQLAVDQLAVVLCPLELEELTRIWNALQTPYRLSVGYEVRIALLHSQIERAPSRVETKIDVYEHV
jgi:hypothetical protein